MPNDDLSPAGESAIKSVADRAPGPASSARSASRSEDGVSGAHPTDAIVNDAVARLQPDLRDWRYGTVPLCDLATTFHDWSTDLWARFLPATWKAVPISMPVFLFCFEPESPRRLGHYRPGRNHIGLRWEINVNPRHLSWRTEAQVAAVVLHELLHCFEDLAGSAPRSRNGYHSAWFRRSAGELGIPCTKHGAELAMPADSPFARWSAERGLRWSETVTLSTVGVGGEGMTPGRQSPKRVAWSCECPAATRVVVLVARATELRARCEACGALFHRVKR